MLVDPENQQTRWQEQGKTLCVPSGQFAGGLCRAVWALQLFPAASNEVSSLKPYVAMQRPVILWFSSFSGLAAEKIVSSH